MTVNSDDGGEVRVLKVTDVRWLKGTRVYDADNGAPGPRNRGVVAKVDAHDILGGTSLEVHFVFHDASEVDRFIRIARRIIEEEANDGDA